MASTLTPKQNLVMALTERITAGVSIFGILFIILTYIFSSYFSKPINRLVFYASWGNLGLCIVALISMNGPDAGDDSALCQFQGFMAQLYSFDPRQYVCAYVDDVQVSRRGCVLGILHGGQHLPRILPGLQHEATTRAGSQVLYCLLWSLPHPSHYISVRRDERARQDIWRGSCELLILVLTSS